MSRLTAAHLATYHHDGYLVVRGLLPRSALAALEGECDRLLAADGLVHPDNMRCRFHFHPETGAQILDAIDPVTDLSPAIGTVAAGAALAGTVGELLAERACLFKDKLIFKQPGSTGYALHQDFIAWPGFPRSFTTVLLALDESTAENGCLEVFAGCHKGGLLSAADGDYHDLPEAAFPRESLRSLPLAPGDAVIFGAYLPHRSGQNRSAGPRRHLYLSYNAQSDGGDGRARHYTYFQHWLARRYAEYGYTSHFYR